MSGYLPYSKIHTRAIGLNIEGYRPVESLPSGCDWYNLILAVDEPLKGMNWDRVMSIVKENKYSYIEQAIPDFDINSYIDTLILIITRIKTSNSYKNMLIHVHQYTGTTILHETLQERTGIQAILDTTNFFESPINYSVKYPTIDCLISISQCASLHPATGTLIVPSGFMDYDVKESIVYTNLKTVQNKVLPYLNGIKYEIGIILVVNDLWIPTEFEIQNEGVLLLNKTY